MRDEDIAKLIFHICCQSPWKFSHNSWIHGRNRQKYGKLQLTKR